MTEFEDEQLTGQCVDHYHFFYSQS